MNKLRVILFSDILPRETSGGELVLYRHLIESGDFDTLLLKPLALPPFQSSLWKRLKKTRLFRLCSMLEEICQRSGPTAGIRQEARAFGADVVLTVAHGRGYHQAVALARQLKRPLATIYHDWWPDISSDFPIFHRVTSQRFHWTAQQSRLCLCVSRAMLEQLDCRGHSVVLPPVPGRQIMTAERKTRCDSGPFRVGYFGNLYDYAPMLGSLVNASLSRNDLKLELRGGQPNWTDEQTQRFTEAKILLPFVARQEFEDWLAGLDAVLCVMSFESHMHRRMETSFPSKLIDALQFGKPIVVWGPEYSSAIQWAREHQACLCITDPNADAAIASVAALANDPSEQLRLAATAKNLAMTELAPDTIHRQFIDVLQDVCAATQAACLSHAHAR